MTSVAEQLANQDHQQGQPYGLRDHCSVCDGYLIRQAEQGNGPPCDVCRATGVPMVTMVRLESLIPWRTIRVARCAPGDGCAEKTARHKRPKFPATANRSQ